MILKISGWDRGIKKTPVLRFSCSLQDEPYVCVISHITTKQERPSDPPLEKKFPDLRMTSDLRHIGLFITALFRNGALLICINTAVDTGIS